ARTVLRETALGNKCRPPDQDVFRAQETIMRFICETSCFPIVQQVVGQTLVTNYARGSCTIAKQVVS
ncbi:hypothetical protein, partial [Vibrio splendidus]|uniref:hypothetical protein n=1 Tax=Vibrio splendidus TaxID=29497 RepID=UPI00352D4050